MSAETLSTSIERMEDSLRQKLEDDVHFILMEDGAGNQMKITLLDIYDEWMEYLRKKHRSDIYIGWRNLLYYTSASAALNLLVRFFGVKRAYNKKAGNSQNYWYISCQNLCNELGLNIGQIYPMFNSYSAAERRIRKEVKEGQYKKITREHISKVLSPVSVPEETANNPENVYNVVPKSYKKENYTGFRMGVLPRGDIENPVPIVNGEYTDSEGNQRNFDADGGVYFDEG